MSYKNANSFINIFKVISNIRRTIYGTKEILKIYIFMIGNCNACVQK